MSSISTYKPTHKIICLSSVSRGAVLSLVSPGAYLLCAAALGNVPARHKTQNGVWVFLTWLRIWLDWLCGQKYIAGSTQIREPDIINRRDRRMVERMAGRKMLPGHSWSVLFHLCGKTLRPTQFLELMCSLSLLGRVRIFSLRFRGSVLQRRALLICYDHGWWRAPLGDMGRVNGGLWRAHLWPN